MSLDGMRQISDKQWIQERLDHAVSHMIHEMSASSREVNPRLDRIDDTLAIEERRLAALLGSLERKNGKA